MPYWSRRSVGTCNIENLAQNIVNLFYIWWWAKIPEISMPTKLVSSSGIWAKWSITHFERCVFYGRSKFANCLLHCQTFMFVDSVVALGLSKLLPDTRYNNFISLLCFLHQHLCHIHVRTMDDERLGEVGTLREWSRKEIRFPSVEKPKWLP